MEKIKALTDKYPNSAPKVPVLPEVVTVADLSDNLKGLTSVPVGIEKESLKVRSLDFTKNLVHIITGMELGDLKTFGGLFIKEVSNVIGKNCYVFDLEKIYKDYESYVTYYDTNILDSFKSFGKFVFDSFNKFKEAGFDSNALKDQGEYVCFIIGLEKFKNVLGTEFDGAYSGLISMIKSMPKFYFVLLDTCDNFKKREFDSWYKDTISGTKGIWIGNGMSTQYTLKSTLTSRILGAKLDKNFGYYVDGNTTVLVKYISELGEEEVYETL
jgi:S-DNA-T family DNA segregation ATPase FtsK/SpoIIIE